MADQKQYKELLEEMLDLAGVTSINEADEDDDDQETDAPADTDQKADADAEQDVEADGEDDEEEQDEELADKWSVQISTGSKMEIEFHDTYIWVWYRNRRSKKISIPQKLRRHLPLVSSFVNEIMSHVEKVS